MSEEFKIKRFYGKVLAQQRDAYAVYFPKVRHHARASKQVFVERPKAIVKMNYASASRLRSILNYIDRKEAKTMGETMFSEHSDNVNKKDITALDGEEKVFRVVLSPEYSNCMDLKEYTRLYMARLSAHVGKDLLWCAVEHGNTDHPHTHVLIRGIDKDNTSVYFDKSVFKSELREIAEEVATDVMVYEQFIEEEKTRKQISQLGVIAMDESIITKGDYYQLSALEKKRVQFLYECGILRKQKSTIQITDYMDYMKRLSDNRAGEQQHETL